MIALVREGDVSLSNHTKQLRRRMTNKATIKVNHFTVDQNLMYLVQQTTGDSTEAILAYFYNLALSIMECLLENKKLAHKVRITRTLDWHYKSTSIPYRLDVWSRETELNSERHVSIDVRFPSKKASIDAMEMINSIMESELKLDGSSALPAFSKPKTRVPAGFKKQLHK